MSGYSEMLSNSRPRKKETKWRAAIRAEGAEEGARKEEIEFLRGPASLLQVVVRKHGGKKPGGQREAAVEKGEAVKDEEEACRAGYKGKKGHESDQGREDARQGKTEHEPVVPPYRNRKHGDHERCGNDHEREQGKEGRSHVRLPAGEVSAGLTP